MNNEKTFRKWWDKNKDGRHDFLSGYSVAKEAWNAACKFKDKVIIKIIDSFVSCPFPMDCKEEKDKCRACITEWAENEIKEDELDEPTKCPNCGYANTVGSDVCMNPNCDHEFRKIENEIEKE